MLCMMREVGGISYIVGRSGCVISCVVQNCATGYCRGGSFEGGYGICVCSRCADGTWVSL